MIIMWIKNKCLCGETSEERPTTFEFYYGQQLQVGEGLRQEGGRGSWAGQHLGRVASAHWLFSEKARSSTDNEQQQCPFVAQGSLRQYMILL